MFATPLVLRPSRLVVALLATVVLAFLPLRASGQSTPRDIDGFRVGVTLGGTGLVGLTVEYVTDRQLGVEATVATFSFRDLGLAVTGRGYFGGGHLRPVVGAGLWYLRSFGDGDRGSALLVRAPLGFDWRVTGEQFLGVTVSTTRALRVTRAEDVEDPEGDGALGVANEGRLVPLPGFSWRWRP